MLSKIVKCQKELQKLVDKHGVPFKGDKEMVMSYMSAIVSETDEVNRAVGFQWWKKHRGIDYANLREELSDIFIFWLDLIIRLGIEDTIFESIQIKQRENVERQKGNIEGREDYKA